MYFFISKFQYLFYYILSIFTFSDSSPLGVVAKTPIIGGLACGKGGRIDVELNKGAVGLGFCIEGGKGSPLGDRPITVKRLFKGK